MNSIDKKRYIWVIISALIQGLLLGIYVIIPNGILSCMPLNVIFLVPFVFWLSQEHWGRRLFNFLAGLTGVLLIFWLYRLWSLYPASGNFYYVPSQKSELIRVSMAVFLIIPFFQCRIAAWSWKFPYSEIFFQFCRNLFMLFQASIVIAVFWGLLVTAGLLFDIVGLDSVPYIIFNPIIAVPLTSVTIAISTSVAIKHPGIDSLGRWILSVLGWLLPFFSLLSLIFILCLPYSGLQTLWSTGQASTLMLLLQFGTIILTNAAWLDGNKVAFRTRIIDLFARVSLLCLPVYFGLCLYSLGLRVAQYGLSTDRVQAFFFVIVMGFWGIGYAGAVLLRKWPSSIGKVNSASIIFMIILITAMNSPILDPYRLAAFNQMHRLQSGEIQPEEFDYIYTRFNLGRYGNQVLNELSQSESDVVKEYVKSAMSADPKEYSNYMSNNTPPVPLRREIISNAKVFGDSENKMSQYVDYFVEEWTDDGTLRDINNSDEIAFVFLKIRKDHEPYLILFTENAGMVYDVENNSTPELAGIIHGKFTPFENLKNIAVTEPEFFDIKISEDVYQVLR